MHEMKLDWEAETKMLFGFPSTHPFRRPLPSFQRAGTRFPPHRLDTIDSAHLFNVRRKKDTRDFKLNSKLELK